MTAHYIDNKQFLQALIEYKEQVSIAKENDHPIPQVTNYIGDCFIKIATHLSYKSNFINYSFKDEMISDGIENCLAVVSNFDPAKSSNPFAYFTQIVYYAFIRRIQKEKKQQEIKLKYISNLDFDSISMQDHEDGDFDNQYVEYLRRQLETKAEEPTEKKKNKKEVASLPFADDQTY